MHVDIRIIDRRPNNAAIPLDGWASAADERIVVAISGGDTAFSTPAGVIGLWWPMRGSVTLSTSDYVVAVGRREVYVSDAQRMHSVLLDDRCTVLSLLATPTLWGSLLASVCRSRDARSATAFPALHALPPALRRQMLSIARAAMAARSEGQGRTIHPALAILQTLQAKFLPEIQRCPGRNMSQRRAVFLRLQRVRNLLSLSIDAELDMRQVAAAANYSLWRFIRVFAGVFGETPYAYVSRCRLDRARGMLLDASLAISDVAAAVGYETSVALSRAIRRRYGVPASRLRAGVEEESLLTRIRSG